MSVLGKRLANLEERVSPGGVIAVLYYDSRDDERLAEAERRANAQGAILVVIQRYSDPNLRKTEHVS